MLLFNCRRRSCCLLHTNAERVMDVLYPKHPRLFLSRPLCRYLSQQIVPPVSRLCEPIEGTSMAILAEKMGLDVSKFTSHVSSSKPLSAFGWTDDPPPPPEWLTVPHYHRKCHSNKSVSAIPATSTLTCRSLLFGHGTPSNVCTGTAARAHGAE